MDLFILLPWAIALAMSAAGLLFGLAALGMRDAQVHGAGGPGVGALPAAIQKASTNPVQARDGMIHAEAAFWNALLLRSGVGYEVGGARRFQMGAITQHACASPGDPREGLSRGAPHAPQGRMGPIPGAVVRPSIAASP
ncbi:MAG: hypothetical protein AAGJ32_02825 [Pseudomonadota bacterium]